MSHSGNNKRNIGITTQGEKAPVVISKVSGGLYGRLADVAERRGLSLCAALKEAVAKYVESYGANLTQQTPCEREDCDPYADPPQSHGRATASRWPPTGDFRTKGHTHGKDIPRLHRHRRWPHILKNGARTVTTDSPQGIQACDPKHKGKRTRARLFCTQARCPVVCCESNASPIPASEPHRRQPGKQSGGQSGMVQLPNEYPARPRATPTPSPRPNDRRGCVGTVSRSGLRPNGRGFAHLSPNGKSNYTT